MNNEANNSVETMSDSDRHKKALRILASLEAMDEVITVADTGKREARLSEDPPETGRTVIQFTVAPADEADDDR